MHIDFEFCDELSSEQLAQKLASCLVGGLVLAFSGQIGAGKTSFIRALLRALGETGAVKSPSFSIIESYSCPNFVLHHFDLYRIQDEEELDALGFRDYFESKAVCCIEWPEKAEGALKDVDLHFAFLVKGEGRLLKLEARSLAGETVFAHLIGNS